MQKLLSRLVAVVCAVLILVTAPAHAQEERSDWLDIELGKSIVLELPKVPRAISVTNPQVADIVQLGSATRWQVQGSQIGTTDLVIQFAGESVPPMIYEVTVHRDLSDLIRRVDSIVPGKPPRVYPLSDRIVVEGAVDDLDTLERVALVSRIYDPDFVNLMTVRGDHQVQLEVIFAEVNRTATKSMGFNAVASPSGYQFGIQDGSSIDIAQGLTNLNFNPTSFNLWGVIGQGINIVGLINILDDHNLAKVIAQPTLVALSGQKSEFLAGGRVPFTSVNAQGNVNIVFQEFGTQLYFTPTVLANDVIDLQLGVEISDLDDTAGIKLGSFNVPGFATRSLRGHVRLRSGETFAIAGLLKERTVYQRGEVPGLGRIPILGMFFRKFQHIREETEILVYVTPRLVRPLGPGEVPPILGTTENNNPSDLALFLLGADRRAKSRTASPTGDVGLQR